MRKQTNRFLALVLVVLMLFTSAPVMGFAGNSANDDALSPDSIGSVLAAAEDADVTNAKSSLLEASLNNNVVTVNLLAAEAGTVVAAVYDNDGLRMLFSGYEAVEPSYDADGNVEQQTVEVTLNMQEELTSALLKVFLLDKKYYPLCKNLTVEVEKSYEAGDTIEFGSYPQSEVKDAETLAALNALDLNWISYGYYIGEGQNDNGYGTMQSGDWMEYADVIYNGNKYRAVRFSQYRPYYAIYTSTAEHSRQDENGYYVNNTYWFKYEPLKWRLLDLESGLVICESIIDSQPYSNTVYRERYSYWNNAENTIYANDYKTSFIREWLNSDFYYTAFTEEERDKIDAKILDNSAAPGYSQYDSESTTDKIWILSLDEVANAEYGFSPDLSEYDTVRYVQGTDYAKSQGLYVYRSPESPDNGNSTWWLRSAGFLSYFVYQVFHDGSADGCNYVYDTSHGVLPVLNLNPETFKSANKLSAKADTTYTAAFDYAIPGEEYVILVVRDDTAEPLVSHDNLLFIDQQTAQSDSITFTYTLPEGVEPADVKAVILGKCGHKYGDPAWSWSDDKSEATATFTCTNTSCGDTQEVQAKVETKVTADPTCTEKGSTAYNATVTFNAASYTDTQTVQDIPTLGHRTSDWVIVKPATCTEEGLRQQKCTVCGEIIRKEAISKLPHTDTDGDSKCDNCGQLLGGHDDCICHKGNVFSKVIRWFCTLLTKIVHKEIKCCEDMEFYGGKLGSIS